MRSLAKATRAVKVGPPDHLFAASMAADLASNSAYYSLVAAGKRERALATGAVLGLMAGVGAVLLPAPLGLGVGPTDRTMETKLMSVGLYVAGGLAAGAVYSEL